MYTSNGNRKCSDIFNLFDSRYKQTVEIGQLGFKYPMVKLTALNESPLTFMKIRSVLSVNFESTVNDVLGHDDSRKITIFKFITVIRYSDNNACAC